jgi:hypothetical protein
LPLAALGLWRAWPYFGRHSDLLQWERLAIGAARFAVTPLPWSIEDSYSFLLLPSILHLVLAVPATLGAWCLWRQCPGARLPLLYAAVVLGFYAVAEDLQGPRHRVQIGFVVTWVQFHGVWTAARLLLARSNPAAVRLANSAPWAGSPRRVAA